MAAVREPALEATSAASSQLEESLQITSLVSQQQQLCPPLWFPLSLFTSVSPASLRSTPRYCCPTAPDFTSPPLKQYYFRGAPSAAAESAEPSFLAPNCCSPLWCCRLNKALGQHKVWRRTGFLRRDTFANTARSGSRTIRR